MLTIVVDDGAHSYLRPVRLGNPRNILDTRRKLRYNTFMENETNIYEDAARNLKAGRLAAFLAARYAQMGALDHAVQATGQLSDETWEQISFAVGVNPPSAKTVWLVQDLLASAEAAISPNED